MKKNSSIDWKIVLIILLTIILVFLIGFIIVNERYYKVQPIDKNVQQEEQEEQNQQEEQKQQNNESSNENIRELTQSEIDTLKSQIEITTQYFAEYYPLNSVDDISNQNLLKSMYIISGGGSPSFSATKLDEIMPKYFGNTKKLIHENMICENDGIADFLYDATTHSYNYNNNHPGHGGGGFISRVKAYEVKGTIKDEKVVTVTAKILYGNYCSDTCIGGYSYYASIPGESAILLFQSTAPEEFIITDEKYNEVASKIPITSFTFEKDSDGNYGLKTVSIQ